MTAPVATPGAVNIQSAAIASVATLYAPAVAVQGTASDSDAQAYFAAMTVQPSAARKGLLRDLIAGLKADGAWAKLRGFWLLAAHDAQAARLQRLCARRRCADRGQQPDLPGRSRLYG